MSFADAPSHDVDGGTPGGTTFPVGGSTGVDALPQATVNAASRTQELRSRTRMLIPPLLCHEVPA